VGKNSAWLTAGILVADVVGAGVLSMPLAVANLGWLTGGLVMILMLFVNVHISILMWRVRMHCPEAHSYVDLAMGAFAGAPAWQRHAFATATVASQMIFMFCVLSLYLLSIGKGLGMLFHNVHLCLPTWALLAVGLLLPCACTSREMGSYKALVWVNILTLAGAVAIPLGYMMYAGIGDIRPEGSHPYAVLLPSITGVLSALNTFSFGFSGQFILTEVISEMQDPAEFPRSYALSAPFQLAAFLAAGLGGYLLVGDKISGMISENIPFGPVFQLAAICLVVHMLVSYLIKGVVFCGAVQRAIDREYSDSGDRRWRSWLSWDAIVLVVLLSAWLMANLVPFFADAVGLLGASLTPLSCFVIPILMFMRWYADAGIKRPHVSGLEWALMFCELALAVALILFGTITSLQDIRGHWHTYGGPFQCHCEGLWRTCACSGNHIGMEACAL